MESFIFLLEGAASTVVNPTNGAVNTTGAEVAGDVVQQTSIFANPIVMIVLYCIVIFGAMYFFSIKPQKKREAAFNDMRSKIKVDDSVLLANGMYGKVADITAECFIVEFGTNKGVRIPVLKQEVAAIREPNLTNKVEVIPQPEKKPLFGLSKKSEENEK